MVKPLDKTDPRLRTACKEILRRDLHKKKTQLTVDALLDYVYGRNNKGSRSNKAKPMTIGLSANQVGIMEKICIVDFAVRRRDHSDVHIFLNPEILWHAKTIVNRWEGCVNFPDIWGEVPRYKSIKVKALDRWGNEFVITAKGWQAVLLQHEIDHLNGTLFIDRLEDPAKAHFVKPNQYKLYKKNHKHWKQFIDVSKWAKKMG